MKLSLSKTAKIMCGVLAGLFAVSLAAGLAIGILLIPFEPPRAYTIGLLTGTLLSAVKVILMEKSLNRAADMGEFGSARNYGFLQVSLRNLLTLGFFLLVFFFNHIFGLYGAIIGVLSLQPAAAVTGYILRKETAQI